MNKNLNFFQMYFKSFVLTSQFMKKCYVFSIFSKSQFRLFFFQPAPQSFIRCCRSKKYINRVQLVSMQFFSLAFHIRSCMMNVRLYYCLDFPNWMGERATKPETQHTNILDSFECKTSSSNKRKSKLRLYFPTNVIIAREHTQKLLLADNYNAFASAQFTSAQFDKFSNFEWKKLSLSWESNFQWNFDSFATESSLGTEFFHFCVQQE